MRGSLQQGHLLPNVDVKSIYLHDTRRELPDQVMEEEQGWVMQGVLARVSFRRPPLSGQKTFTVLFLHISKYPLQENGVLRKNSSLQSEQLCLVNMLTWLQVISMEQRGGAAIETASVLLTKPLQTAHFQRRRALHHCG